MDPALRTEIVSWVGAGMAAIALILLFNQGGRIDKLAKVEQGVRLPVTFMCIDQLTLVSREVTERTECSGDNETYARVRRKIVE